MLSLRVARLVFALCAAGTTVAFAAEPPNVEHGQVDDIPEAEALHAALSAKFLEADYDAALRIAHDLLQRRRASLGTDHPTVTASLSDIATIMGRRGDVHGAIEAYTEALELRIKALGASHPDVGALYTLRSTAYYKLGMMDEAESDLLVAYDLVPVTDRRYAFILQNLGGIALMRGHGDQATRLLEQSLNLRLEHDGPEHPGTLSVAAMWATATMDHRPLVEGCAASDDIHQWTIERFGQDHPSSVSAWQNRARCRRNRADLEGAEHDLRMAIAAASQDKQGVPYTLQGELAALELLRGDVSAALARVEAALPELEALKLTARYAALQTIYGRLLLATGRNEEAYSVALEAHRALTAAVGPDSEATLLAQKYLGRALLATGRDGGPEMLTAAVDRLRGRSGAARADAPWSDVGLLAIKAGEVERGLAILLEGELASIQYYGANNPATLLARVPRIEALIAVGRPIQAREPLMQAVSLYSAWQAQAQAGKNSRQAMALSALGHRLQDLALVVLSAPDDEADAWRIVLSLKGGARRSIDTLAAQTERSQQTQQQWSKLSEVRRARARALLNGQDESVFQAERDALEEAIAESASQPLAAVVDPAALQAALPRRTALVDLVVVGGQRPRLVAFVATTSQVRRIDLGEIADVERIVKRFIAVLQANSFEPDVVEAVRMQAGRALIGPFGDALRGIKHVWLVPDGPVARLPFAALPDYDGRYIVERRTIRVLEDARDVLAKPRAKAGGDALVIGGVDYGSGHSAACTPGPFASLPGTALEAQIAAAALNTSPLIGSSPTFDEVRARLPSAGVVHLATHGFYADRCETDDSMDALALSGVALAGANAGATGVLTASDVLDLDLSHTELVVLSACQTGSGRVEVGEGVLGLRWALHRAGAGSLLLAMYRVPDAPTVALMERFYHHWRPGKDAAVALRRAQRDRMRHQRRNDQNQPGEWAGFVVSGAP